MIYRILWGLVEGVDPEGFEQETEIALRTKETEVSNSTQLNSPSSSPQDQDVRPSLQVR